MVGYREMLLQYINNLDVEQPILTSQVTRYIADIVGRDEDAVKKVVNVNMDRLENAGHIVRVAKGVYCRKVKTAFGDYTPNKEIIFCKQLLKDENGIIGYESGLSALNRVGLVSQMPNRRCIVTNLHTKKIPEGMRVELRKPAVMIDDGNYRYLQMLDMIEELDQAPVDTTNPAKVVQEAARGLGLSVDRLILYARKYYNQKTLLRTIDIMLEGVYETARG